MPHQRARRKSGKKPAAKKGHDAAWYRRACQQQQKRLREHLLDLLRGEGAHVNFDKAIEGIPPASHGARPSGQPFTLWQILEHLRIAQWDILEFSRNPKHVSPAWPKGYWPESEAPPGDDSWQESVDAFRSDLKSMERLVASPATDLYARIPWGTGQTVLREALLVADHNAYHVGQLVLLRRLLGVWPAD